MTEKFKDLNDLFDKYIVALRDSLNIYFDSPAKVPLKQVFYDTAVVFADTHDIGALVPALKAEADKLLEQMNKDFKKEWRKLGKG